MGSPYLIAHGLGKPVADASTEVTVPEDGPYETVAGYIMSELGRLPIEGDTVAVDGGEFRVERLDGRRIDRVRFTPTPSDTDENGATS